jgi:DNA-binding NtrC family response regulator
VQVFESGPASRRILERAKRAGASGLPLVLVGESGTGKELLAATIHHASPRAGHPFRRFDCAASNSLDNPPAADPVFADVGPGTIYLDRLHTMSLAAQAQLAEVLPPPSASCATIAAIETPPDTLVQQGLLIDRLARRLGDVVLTVPPLRSRPDEIPTLAQHLLGLIAPHRPLRLASSTVPLLEAYDWPGNLREIKTVLERAASDLHGDLIRPRDLPPHVRGDEDEEHETPGFPTLVEIERRHIEAALEANHGCISSAARDLGISRPRLYRLIDRLGLAR